MAGVAKTQGECQRCHTQHAKGINSTRHEQSQLATGTTRAHSGRNMSAHACMPNSSATSQGSSIATKKKFLIGHHARSRRASATVPLCTGADTCKTGSGARKRSGGESDPVRRRSNHAWTEDQAGGRKRASTDAVRGWRVHTADDTPSRNAATRSKKLDTCLAERHNQLTRSHTAVG